MIVKLADCEIDGGIAWHIGLVKATVKSVGYFMYSRTGDGHCVLGPYNFTGRG